VRHGRRAAEAGVAATGTCRSGRKVGGGGGAGVVGSTSSLGAAMPHGHTGRQSSFVSVDSLYFTDQWAQLVIYCSSCRSLSTGVGVFQVVLESTRSELLQRVIAAPAASGGGGRIGGGECSMDAMARKP
jgi:hypothetical protein